MCKEELVSVVSVMSVVSVVSVVNVVSVINVVNVVNAVLPTIHGSYTGCRSLSWWIQPINRS